MAAGLYSLIWLSHDSRSLTFCSSNSSFPAALWPPESRCWVPACQPSKSYLQSTTPTSVLWPHPSTVCPCIKLLSGENGHIYTRVSYRVLLFFFPWGWGNYDSHHNLNFEGKGKLGGRGDSSAPPSLYETLHTAPGYDLCFFFLVQELIQKAIDCALEAKKSWERMSFEARYMCTWGWGC